MIITTIALMLILSAFFSGTEIAYISADRLRVALHKQQGSKRGKMIVAYFDNPSQFLGTMLVGNNIALVIFGNLMEKALSPALTSYLPNWLTGELGMLLSITLISTLIVLVFGEFIPKVIFRLFSTSAMMLFSYIHYAIQFILTPLVWMMVKTSEFLLEKILGVNITVDEQVFTRTDLIHFIKNNETVDINTEMFEKAISLKQTLVEQCMVKAEDIVSIDVKENIDKLLPLFTDSGYSKIIVCDNGLDQVLGYVHHLQLLHRPKDIRSILLKIPEVSPEMPVIELMNELMREKTSIGCVKKDGKTVGIIALEDILEEVFGEIEDEHDK